MATAQPISGDQLDGKPVSSFRGDWSRTRRWVILLSPIVILIICQVTARLVVSLFGNSAIYPWLLVYWFAIGGLIAWGGGREAIRRWASPRRGAWGWSALAFLFVPLAFYTALPAWRFLAIGWLWLPWLIFPLFNALIEEGYWRGLLLNLYIPG